MVLDELLNSRERDFFWNWFNQANNDDKINVLFPVRELWEDEYEWQKVHYSHLGIKANRYKFLEKKAIFELPKSYDASNDKKDYEKRKKNFLQDMKELLNSSGKKWNAETEKSYTDNVNFGEKNFEKINTILEKIHNKYSQYYGEDTIKCWFNYEDEPENAFDYPELDHENEGLFLSELINWIESLGLDSKNFYEWILRTQFVEGRYAFRIWNYDLDDINYRKEKATENIRQINEMLRQLYKDDIDDNCIPIYFDFYKDVDKDIF